MTALLATSRHRSQSHRPGYNVWVQLHIEVLKNCYITPNLSSSVLRELVWDHSGRCDAVSSAFLGGIITLLISDPWDWTQAIEPNNPCFKKCTHWELSLEKSRGEVVRTPVIGLSNGKHTPLDQMSGHERKLSLLLVAFSIAVINSAGPCGVIGVLFREVSHCSWQK